jgi:hypothetical protein
MHIPLHLVATSPNATAEIAKLLVEYTIKSHAWESLNSFDNNGDKMSSIVSSTSSSHGRTESCSGVLPL